MKILSLTFHSIETILPHWKLFFSSELTHYIEGMKDIGRLIFSEVETEILNEGKNYNVLLFFENEISRNSFLTDEFPKLEDYIFKHFGNDVMVFKTYINPIKMGGKS